MGPNRPILILIGIILCIVHLSAESSPSQKPKKSDGPPPLSPSVPMPGSNSSTSSLSKSKASQQKNETTPMKKPADDGAPKRGDKNPRPFGSPGPVPPNLRRKGPLRRKGYSDGYSGGENNEYDGQTSNYGVGYDSYGKNYGGNYYGSGEKAYKSYNYLIDDYICDMDASIIVVTNSEKRYKQTYSGKQDYGKQQGYESNDQQNYGKEYGGKSAAYESQPYGNKADYGKKEAYPSGEAYGKKEEYGYNKKGQYDVDEEYSHGSYKEKYTGGERYKRSNGYGAGYPGYENGAYPGYEKNYGGNSGSYGYNKKSEFYRVAKAHRLRCSTIAISSDEDCRTCCQMAARKDRSFTKRSIIGFIVDYSEINQKDYGGYSYKNDYGSSQKRYKRDTYAAPPAIAPSNYQTTGTNYGSDKTTSYGNDAYKTDKTESYSTKDNGEKEKNYGDSYKKGNYESSYGSGDYGSEYYPKKHYNKSPRCVCCAPKSHIQDYGQSQYKPQGDKGYGYDNYGKGYSSPGEGAYSGNYEGHYGPKGSESTEGYY